MEERKTVDLPIPSTAAERAASQEPGREQERALLLTVARLLRAHIRDHIHHPDFSNIDQDWADLNEALQPFDPEEGMQFNGVTAGDPKDD